MHDEFALRVGGIMLVEEGQYLAREGQGGLSEELSVERVIVVLKHQPAELEAAHPLPLVVTAFLELVLALVEWRPAVGFAEDRSPEHDALRVIRPVVAEIEPRAILAEREQFVGIHVEEGTQDIDITGGGEADVREARVLPPIARTPAAIVGIGFRGTRGHSEERAVELDGKRAASHTGGDETLEVIHLADVGGLVAHGRAGAIGHNLAIDVKPATARSGIGHGGDVGPAFGGQRVRLLEDGLATDEAEAVAGEGVEEKSIAATRGDLVHEPRAAASELLRFHPGLDGKAGSKVPGSGIGDIPGLQIRAGEEQSRLGGNALAVFQFCQCGDVGFRQWPCE